MFNKFKVLFAISREDEEGHDDLDLIGVKCLYVKI